MISIEEKAQLKRLELTVELREKRIKRLQEIAGQENYPAFAAMREELDLTLKTKRHEQEQLSEGAIRVLEGSNYEAESRFIGGQALAYKAMLDLLNRAQSKIDYENQMIGQERGRIKELREQMKLGEKGKKGGNIV